MEHGTNESIKSEYSFDNLFSRIIKYSLISLLIIAFASIFVFNSSLSTFLEIICIPLIVLVLISFLILLPLENTFVIEQDYILLSYKHLVTVTKKIPLNAIKSFCIVSNYLIRLGHLETIEIETKTKHYSINFIELKKENVLSIKKREILNNNNIEEAIIRNLIKANMNTILFSISFLVWLLICLRFVLRVNA